MAICTIHEVFQGCSTDGWHGENNEESLEEEHGNGNGFQLGRLLEDGEGPNGRGETRH